VDCRQRFHDKTLKGSHAIDNQRINLMRNNFTPDSPFKSISAPASQNETEVRPDQQAPTGTPRVSSIRLLRLPQVMQQTGLKKTKLYELQKRGSFPMRIQITSNSVGWIEEEVNVWIAGRVAASKPLRIK
jgi:prophage regulatory protein